MEACATVTEVRPVGPYELELVFADNLRGRVDLTDRILGRGGDFQALEDPAFFRQVRVNHELGTIIWPNEVDFCPDLLHAWVAAGHVPAYEAEASCPTT